MAYSIEVKKREGINAEELRNSSLVPGVVYGPDRKALPVSVELNKLEKLYNEAGESTLIDCIIEGEKEPVKVLIQDLQYHPLKNQIIHFDLRQIQMGVEMHATIELNFIGEPVAVKTLGGTLLVNTEELEVKCLPKNLVSSVDVDLSVLTTFDDAIYIKDIKMPEGIKVLDEENTLVAKVIAQLSEERLKAMEEENSGVNVEKVEVEKKGKEETEEDTAKKE
ncbi:MAG: 50S ribosomal protein L25 [Patescibacteria group bacterium]